MLCWFSLNHSKYDPDHGNVVDDPEEHVSGVQQDGHGQLRRRRRRGGEREVHICPVLLGENSQSGIGDHFFRNRETRTLLKTQFRVISKGHLNVPGKEAKLSKLE